MVYESIWPVVAAAVAAVLIGSFWYHPRVFGAPWIRLNATTPEMAERGASRRHMYTALSLIANFLLALVVNGLLLGFGIHDVSSAARFGAVLGVGFALPILLGSFLWEHRPFTLYLINAGYWLVALVAIAVILVL